MSSSSDADSHEGTKELKQWKILGAVSWRSENEFTLTNIAASSVIGAWVKQSK